MLSEQTALATRLHMARNAEGGKGATIINNKTKETPNEII